MKQKDIYILIPVHNEGKSIYQLLANFSKTLAKVDYNSNLIVVNDCSSDNTQNFITKAIDEFDLNINLIEHEINKGLQGALKTGFDLLKNIEDDSVVITLDGDNTHNPSTIIDMLESISIGADIVIASRYCEGSKVLGLSKFRELLSWGAKILYMFKWRIPNVKDYTCNFRAYRGWLVKSVLSEYKDEFITEKGFTVTTEILKKMNTLNPKIVEVPMILNYSNKENVSNMNVFKTILLTLKTLINQ